MASVSDICNMALSHIGSDATITSISPPDGSVEAGHCARFYSIARKEALESSKWTWSKTRAALAEVTNASLVWTYAYALPSDCLSPVRVLQAAVVQELMFSNNHIMTADDYQLFTERGSADFEVEDGVLYTHEPDAVLLYTRDVTDTTKFSTSFTVFVSYLLASFLAGPILKGMPGVQASGALRQVAGRVRAESAVDDANGSSERAEHIPDFMRVR